MEKDRSRKLPWVSIWMIGFGFVGLLTTLYGAGGGLGSGAWSVAENLAAYVALTAVLIIGLLRHPALERRIRIRTGVMPLEELWGVFLTAWRSLWRSRWLLWLFGSLAAMRVVGGAVEHLLVVHCLFDRFDDGLDSLADVFINKSSSFLGHLVFLPTMFAGKVAAALHEFLPSLWLGRSTPAVVLNTVLLVILAVWAHSRLRRFSRGTTHAQDAVLIHSLLAPVVLIAVAATFALSWGYKSHLLSTTGGTWLPPGLFVGNLAWSLIATLFLLPILTGGVVGSLRRVSGGGAVTADSFLAESVRYFKPMSGLYALSWVLGLAVSMPLLLASVKGGDPPSWYSACFPCVVQLAQWGSLLLMFVPLAVVLHGKGTIGSIRTGIADWLRNAWDAAAFIALGISLIAMTNVFIDILLGWTGPRSLLHLATGAIGTTVSVIVSAVMLLAVWEFYKRVLDKTKEVPAVEGSAEV